MILMWTYCGGLNVIILGTVLLWHVVSLIGCRGIGATFVVWSPVDYI